MVGCCLPWLPEQPTSAFRPHRTRQNLFKPPHPGLRICFSQQPLAAGVSDGLTRTGGRPVAMATYLL
jgi:hypothetical protein